MLMSNVHEIVTRIIQSIIGKHPFGVTIKKADFAVQIPAKFISKSVEKCSMRKFTADLQFLFQRALNLASSEEVNVTLHECL